MTESFDDFKIQRHEAAHRQIARNLRERILLGKIEAGSRLPSTEELAETWGASYFTVHMALKALVKEGLLERLHGSGTYVREKKASLSCVGIYLGGDVMTTNAAGFARYVYLKVEEKLRKRGISVMIFVESRPASEHDTILPALRQAVDLREIQALIVPRCTPKEISALGKLPIPMAVISGLKVPCRAGFNDRQFVQTALATLKAQGCKTVGMITHMIRLGKEESERLYGPTGAPEFWSDFNRDLTASGLVSREEWLLGPSRPIESMAKIGYAEFLSLWRLPEKPDGLIVWPDMVVGGAITAMLQLGVRIPEEIKCVFHRNRHQEILCPFPVTWGTGDEEELAESLIGVIDRQFKGLRISETNLDYIFSESAGIELD